MLQSVGSPKVTQSLGNNLPQPDVGLGLGTADLWSVEVPNSEISGAVYKIHLALIPCIKACGILLQLFFLSTLMIHLDPELSSVAYQ